MSIKKQFLKSKDLYKVTWSLDKKAANSAENVVLSGDFNNWSLSSDNFTKLKNGSFKLTLELPKDKEYQFRYLVDGKSWLNEKDADKFVDNQISNEQNCVLSL
ncbi:MAG: isoamylase early set domain-containing protein [Reichenbachiella sp.]